MVRGTPSIAIPSLEPLDRAAGNLAWQLTHRIRDAIATGELRSGERLPSTRTLAASLDVARGTVVEAFEQLAAEGYLVSGIGAGTRVAPNLETGSAASASIRVRDAKADAIPEPASRLAALAGMLAPQTAKPFAIAAPSAGIEPGEPWRRLSNRVRALNPGRPAGYADPQGVYELRCAIVEHVRRFRAVTCEPEQVIVTSGTQQGLYMAAQILLSPSDRVWAEDPAYPGLTAVLDHLGARTHRVPVDDQGFRVEQAKQEAPDALTAFVTPSHQYPIGMPLGMRRRQALVAWAVENGRWIVEDDYDSELRYAGHPFPAMQGMAPSRVIYLGTFSKVLFPSLRLGYVIAPPPLVDAFVGAHALLDRHVATADQHVLAAYMRDALLEAHIRRIRGPYAERRTALITALDRDLPAGCAVQPSAQGMHILLWLPTEVDDIVLERQLGSDGIVARAISPMYAQTHGKPGLMLGFGGFEPGDLEVAARRLIEAIRAAQHG